MRSSIIILIFSYIFISLLAYGSNNSNVCKKLQLITITKHKSEDFDVYMFLETHKVNNKKDSIFYFVFVDSIQRSFCAKTNTIKTKTLKVGKSYNICLKKLLVYDKKLGHHEADIRGMDVYNLKNYYGFVFITNDIQNRKIIKRKSGDTLDYFKRFPICLHGYP
jgi:hypothetical protein